jgi:hypothetical protein
LRGTVGAVAAHVWTPRHSIRVSLGGRDGSGEHPGIRLGREQEAKAAAAEYLTLTSDFSISRHLELLPFQRPEDREHYAEGLRKAGLPE